MREFMIIVENSLDNPLIICEAENPNGFWVTDKGQFLYNDWQQEIHHMRVAADHFGTDSDSAFDQAMALGWVRVIVLPGAELNAQWSVANPKALRALRTFVRQSGTEYPNYFIEGMAAPEDPEVGIDKRAFLAILDSHIASIVNEAFDHSTAITWEPHPTRDGVERKFMKKGSFVVGDQTFIIAFMSHESEGRLGTWTMLFYADKGRGDTTIADTGEMKSQSLKVFGVVIGAIEEFLIEFKPEIVMFSGDKGGRSALYRRMIKVLEPRLGRLGYGCHIKSSGAYAEEFEIYAAK